MNKKHKTDILKYFIHYNNTNMEVEEQIDISQDKTSQKLMEQLKCLIQLVLHFKYMLVFVEKHCHPEIKLILKKTFSDEKFFDDFDYCSNKFSHLIESSIFFDFIRQQEQVYKTSLDLYSPFKRDNDAKIDQIQQVKHSPTLLNFVTIDNIVTVPDFPSASSSSGSIAQEDSLNQSTNNEFEDFISETHDDINDNDDSDYQEVYETPSATETIKPNSSSTKTKKVIPEKQKLLASTSTPTYDEQVRPRSFLFKDDESSEVVVTQDMLQVEYWCSYDGCRFKSKLLNQVKLHEERRHVKQMRKCSYDGCAETFENNEDLDSHMKTQHFFTQEFKCTVKDCDKVFPKEFHMRQHVRQEHRETLLICSVCSKTFNTTKLRNRHFKRMHTKKTEDAADDDEDDSDHANSETEIETDDEKDVKKSSNTVAKLLPNNNNKIKCTIGDCNKSFDKKLKLKQHVREEHTQEYLTCKFCDRVCKTRNNLTNHVWIMHEEGDFRCNIDNCTFTSKFRKNLLNHKKLRHQRVRKCPIDNCGQMLPITRYQRHMSSFHKLKNYTCSWPDCGKSFADHNALKNHVRIHLNFKRFKCSWPECGYASEQRFTVITHIRVCHFKLPRTKKKQLEMNITAYQNPYDYLEICREDICI